MAIDLTTFIAARQNLDSTLIKVHDEHGRPRYERASLAVTFNRATGSSVVTTKSFKDITRRDIWSGKWQIISSPLETLRRFIHHRQLHDERKAQSSQRTTYDELFYKVERECGRPLVEKVLSR